MNCWARISAQIVEEQIEGCGNAVLVRPHPPPTVVIGHDQQMPLALSDRQSQLVSPTDNGRPRKSQIRCNLQLKPLRERLRVCRQGSAEPRRTFSGGCPAGESVSF
jgi:hypothetical protein